MEHIKKLCRPALILASFVLLPLRADELMELPVVEAGSDTTIRLGVSFRFSAKVTLGGGPSAQYTAEWSQMSGPDSGADILVSDALRSSVEFSLTGVYLFRLSITEENVTVCDTMECTVLDSIPFIVLTPQTGAKVQIGSPCLISWQLDPPAAVTIQLSTNNGKTFTNLVQSQIHDTFWVWEVDKELGPSSGCIIKVSKYFDFTSHTTTGLISLVDGSNAVFPSARNRVLNTARVSGRQVTLTGRNVALDGLPYTKTSVLARLSTNNNGLLRINGIAE